MFLASRAEDAPNILFILTDDLGYGDLRSYNPESKIPTPHLDTLASEGMRFTDAHSGGPLCHASRYALMTGQYSFRINVGLWPRQPLIKEGRTTLPSVLRDNGYKTAMVGKWHLGFKESGYDKPLPGGPADRGFDSFFGIRASTDIPPYFYIRDRKAIDPPTDKIAASPAEPEEGWNNIQGSFWRAGGIAPGLALKDVLPRFTEEAIDGPDGGGFRERGVPKPKRPKTGAPVKGLLYNLRKDPGEKNNLWDANPEIVDRLMKRLKKAVTDGHTAPHCKP